MKPCHKCPHNAEIRRLRETCIACVRKGGNKCDDVNCGRWHHVSLDAMGGETYGNMSPPPDYTPRAPSPPSRVRVPAEVLPYLVKAFEPMTRLTDREASLLAAMMRGETQIEIARRTGVTKAVINLRWRNLVRRNPIWIAVANGFTGRKGGAGFTGRRGGGKRKGKPQRKENGE